MYYYILENTQNNNFNKFQSKLKQILGNLNITGEMAVASPARSAEELATLALDRGYTTIAAVGGDLLVNRLAAVVAESGTALGVIPYNLSVEMGQIFAGNDVAVACNALRSRKTRLIDLGHISQNKYFLTDLVIEQEKMMKFAIAVDSNYSLEATTSRLNISRALRVSFSTDQISKKSWWKKHDSNHIDTTFITAQSHLDIFTETPTSVMVSGHEIVKTPIKVKIAKDVLKIITNRDIIN